jgi:hypothetical protein
MFYERFTKARHCSLSWTTSVQSTVSYDKFLSCSLITSFLGLSHANGFFLSEYPIKIFVRILYLSNAYNNPHLSHRPGVNYSSTNYEVLQCVIFSSLLLLSQVHPRNLPSTLFSKIQNLFFP